MNDYLLTGIIAYLIGSIPFGILLAKLFRLPDPRTIGSGNIGATNMLRTGRKDVALLTLRLDASKGVAAVMIAAHLHDVPHLLAFAALMATLGHMYSPWLKFSGGKGVATMLGGVLTMSFYVGLIFCAAWLGIFLLTFYVSLASIIALIAIPVAALFLIGGPAAFILAIAAAVAIYKHRSNIARLRRGEEPKMKGAKRAE